MTSGAHDHPEYALAASVDDQLAILRGRHRRRSRTASTALEQGDVTVATRTPCRATEAVRVSVVDVVRG